MNREPAHKSVTVEDLMKVKRGERPREDFWASWDRSMQARLSVEQAKPRPWWRDAVPKLWISVARWQVPIGASAFAVLAFSMLAELQTSVPVPTESGRASAPVVVQPVGLQELVQVAAPSFLSPYRHAPGELSVAIATAGSPLEGGLAATGLGLARSMERMLGVESLRLASIQILDMSAPAMMPVPAPALRKVRENRLGFNYGELLLSAQLPGGHAKGQASERGPMNSRSNLAVERSLRRSERF